MPRKGTERDRAALRIDVGRVVRQPERAQHRKRLTCKGRVQLDQVDVGYRQLEASQQLADAQIIVAHRLTSDASDQDGLLELLDATQANMGEMPDATQANMGEMPDEAIPA